MTQIYKNGIVKTTEFNESSAMMLNTFTSAGYTPTTANNNCLQTFIHGFEKGKKYAVEMVLAWSGFKTNVSDNFAATFQGSTYVNGTWSWNYSNYLAGSLANVYSLKTLVLSADSGTQYIYTEFTSSGDATGYELGMRFNYSNGTGKISYSNLKITPLDSFVKDRGDGGKIYDSQVIMNDFIEI